MEHTTENILTVMRTMRANSRSLWQYYENVEHDDVIADSYWHEYYMLDIAISMFEDEKFFNAMADANQHKKEDC